METRQDDGPDGTGVRNAEGSVEIAVALHKEEVSLGRQYGVLPPLKRDKGRPVTSTRKNLHLRLILTFGLHRTHFFTSIVLEGTS